MPPSILGPAAIHAFHEEYPHIAEEQHGPLSPLDTIFSFFTHQDLLFSLLDPFVLLEDLIKLIEYVADELKIIAEDIFDPNSSSSNPAEESELNDAHIPKPENITNSNTGFSEFSTNDNSSLDNRDLQDILLNNHSIDHLTDFSYIHELNDHIASDDFFSNLAHAAISWI